VRTTGAAAVHASITITVVIPRLLLERLKLLTSLTKVGVVAISVIVGVIDVLLLVCSN
jgi:hypothetical protein